MNKTYIYVGGFEMPDKNAAALRVINIAKIMRKLDYNVVFIGTNHDINQNTSIISTKQSCYGFDCYAVAYPKGIHSWINYESDINKYEQVLATIGDYEGIIFYNFPAIAMGRLISQCRRLGKSCFADVTEWNYFGWNGMLWGVIKGIDTWLRMNIMHKKMDGMIVISSYLEKFYCNQKNVVRIPVLADTDDKKWNDIYQKSEDKLKLVYAGNAKKKDRLDYLIGALMNVERTYELDVIGVTKDEYLSYYPRHEEWLNGRNDIRFHGRLAHDETIQYIKKANYSCFFRKDDIVSKAGFPTKFVEALCCRTPVITNNTSDIARYVSDNVNGIIVDRVDEKLIADMIENAPYEMQIDLEFAKLENYCKSIKWVFENNK